MSASVKRADLNAGELLSLRSPVANSAENLAEMARLKALGIILFSLDPDSPARSYRYIVTLTPRAVDALKLARNAS